MAHVEPEVLEVAPQLLLALLVATTAAPHLELHHEALAEIVHDDVGARLVASLGLHVVVPVPLMMGLR